MTALVTRRAALFVLLGVAPLVAGYACSSFSGESAADDDGGAEAQPAMEAAAPDADLDGANDDGAVRGCRVHAIATGFVHSCAVFGSTGNVACWGDNNMLESGADAGTLRTTAGLVPNLSHVKQVTLGQSHSCAMESDGTVWCWGANGGGQLGNGTLGGGSTAVPTKVYGITTATQISAGYYHTCARLADGSVRCWGENSSGQLGDGTVETAILPVTVPISGVAEIALGALHTCARLTDGGVVCWGDNYFGELGIGGDDAGPDAKAPEYAHVALEKIDAGAASRIGSGSASTCGEFEKAPFLRCWGYNTAGILVPNDDAVLVDTPTAVTSSFALDGGTVVTGGYQTCVIAADNALFCWGAGNKFGQTGSATLGKPPTLVSAVGEVDDVASGYLHTCVLSDASVSCFGWDQYGQLGRGTNDVPPGDGGQTPAHAAPVQVVLPCF